MNDIIALEQADSRDLLTAGQMAQFVTDGYLMFDSLVPQELNDAAYEDQVIAPYGYGFWHVSRNIQQVFALPQVRGIIQSLVGLNPVYDHSYEHLVGPRQLKAQEWHADSILDVRPYGFDIQLFYFSHDAPAEMGPTLILPGSHLRKVNTVSIGRYKNIIGQKQIVCKAGTLAVLHHGMWHCAQPNYTDKTRYVFKLRLRPGQEQHGLFNLDGYDSQEVQDIINNGHQAWQGNESRLDHMQRARLWRYVTGDSAIDFSFEAALTRMGIQ